MNTQKDEDASTRLELLGGYTCSHTGPHARTYTHMGFHCAISLFLFIEKLTFLKCRGGVSPPAGGVTPPLQYLYASAINKKDRRTPAVFDLFFKIFAKHKV